MRKSWLSARALSRALPLAVGVALLVWLPASGSAGRARVAALDISPINAEFNSDLRQTTYSLPNALALSYQWTLTLTDVDSTKAVDPDCNNHGNLADTERTFVWHHGNKGDPLFDDGCNHDLQGMWGHQGLITLVVTDSQGDQCTATYKGTFSTEENAALGQNAAGDPVCTQAPTAPPPPPSPPPPPPAKPCKCVKLKVAIVPGSIKIEDHYGGKRPIDYSLIHISLKWTLKCTKGSSGKCEGGFWFVAGERGNVEELKQLTHTDCRGRCGATSPGRTGESVTLDNFPPARRASLGSMQIVIEPYCLKSKAPIKFSIAFTKAGNIDLEKSKLGKL